MSWSISLQATPIDELQDKLAVAIWEQRGNHAGQPNEVETLAQMHQAASATVILARSGAVGESKSVIVQISGHAEPNHIKRDGWAEDYVNIRINQVP